MSGLIWGGLSDMFGRRMIIATCFLLDFVISFACGFAPSYWVMLVLKVLTGVIIAGPNAVLYAYLAEIHDNKHRSMSIMLVGLCFAFSQVVQPVLAYLLLPLAFRLPLLPGVLDLTPWRVFLLACSVPSLVSGLLFLRLPESPKFLMSQGRHEEALRVFRRVYAANTGRVPDSYPIKSLEASEVTQKDGAEGRRESSLQRAMHQFSPLFRKPYLARMFKVISIQVNIMICINSLRLWTPQLFALMEQFEFTDWPGKPVASTACQMISATLNHTAITTVGGADGGADGGAEQTCNAVSGEVYLRSVVIGSVGTSSFIVSSWAAKQFGNRPLLLVSFPLAMVAALGMVWAPDSDVLMGLMASFNPLTAIGLTALSATTVELFPTSLRGVSVSLSIMAGRVASLFGNLILPTLLNLSCEALFWFVSVCLGLCSVLVWFIPRKGKDEDH